MKARRSRRLSDIFGGITIFCVWFSADRCTIYVTNFIRLTNTEKKFQNIFFLLIEIAIILKMFINFGGKKKSLGKISIDYNSNWILFSEIIESTSIGMDENYVL